MENAFPADREALNVNQARRYLAALETFAQGEDLAAYFTPEVEQIEFPNRLVPQGATRGLRDLLDGAIKGAKVLKQASYEILNVLAQGDQVFLEVQWTGILAMPIGQLLTGDSMRARFAVVLEFHDGKIAKQRNYDCFDAF